MNDELEVPEAALQQLRDFDSDGGGPGFVRAEDVRAIAAPVVAAELRRLASILDSGYEALDGEDEAYGAGKADAADLLRNAARRHDREAS